MNLIIIKNQEKDVLNISYFPILHRALLLSRQMYLTNDIFKYFIVIFVIGQHYHSTTMELQLLLSSYAQHRRSMHMMRLPTT